MRKAVLAPKFSALRSGADRYEWSPLYVVMLAARQLAMPMGLVGGVAEGL